jgi:polysaccharide export outer membrane protein
MGWIRPRPNTSDIQAIKRTENISRRVVDMEHSSRRIIFICVLAFLSLSYQASGTHFESDAAEPNNKAVALKIAPGDLVSVTVFDAPELTQDVRVSSDGKVRLSLLGDLPVGGLTAQEASDKIADALREHQLLLRPEVSVLIKEYSSQGVSVLGEVQHPGVFTVLGPRTLLDVIALAGGLTKTADSEVTVQRRSKAGERVSIQLKSDNASSSLANDVQIYPGDMVVVPRAGVVYVLGEVAKPGGYVMQSDGKITLLQLVAQAGGTSKLASPNNSVWMRKEGNGYVSGKLSLSKISKGEEKDVELHPNDVIFVPNSKIKQTFSSMEGVISSIGSASIYAGVH